MMKRFRVLASVRLGSFGGAIVPWMLGLGLGGGLLWYVARHAGSGTGQVFLHAFEPCEFALGPIRMEIHERLYSPIVIDLPAGRYTLVSRHKGLTLREETFDLASGQDVVIAATDPRRLAPPPAQPASPPPAP